MKYYDYLKSKRWKKLRKSVLKRAENKCMICYRGGGKLQIHHRTYERIFGERITDLIALCDRCHKLFHKILPEYKEPVLVDIKIKPTLADKEFQRLDNQLQGAKNDEEVKVILKKISDLAKKRYNELKK